MKRVNVREVPESSWQSPGGKFASQDRELSAELAGGAKEARARFPFDVEICRVPPGKAACPYHSHSAQWEFYHVISGRGQVRDATGLTPVAEGDFFQFGPGEAHQVINDGAEPLVFYIVADNPAGESCHYPDSGKWLVTSPERRVIRSDALDYLDGEE